MTVLVLVAGVWADRMSRRLMMIASDVGRCAVQAVVAVLLLSGSAQLWHLIVLVALYGCFEAFFRPAAGGLIPTLVPAARAPAGELADRARAERGPRLRARGRGRADRRPLPGRGGRRRRGDVRRQRRLPDRAARAAARAAPARARARFPERAQGRDRRGALAALDARVHARVLRLPLDRAALRAGARRRARRPRARRRGLVGGDRRRASARARSPARSSGCAGARAARCQTASIAFIGASCQPAIIALAGSTAAIAAFEALAGVAVAIGFAQWETTLGRLIPGRALSRVTSLDWFTTVGLMPLGYALVGPGRRGGRAARDDGRGDA